MRHYALIGDPVVHSLSPKMYDAAFEAMKIEARYSLQRITAERLEAASESALSDVPELKGLDGFTITAPHKRTFMRMLLNDPGGSVSEQAQRIGAINAVVHKDGRWWGFNTDAPGFLRGLPANKTYESALVIGAGGAARAVVAALVDQGTTVLMTARRPSQLDSFSEFGILPVAWSAIPLHHPLIVNATSASLHQGETFAQAMPWQDSHQNQLFVDLVYDRSGAGLPFLRRAAERGAETLDGLGMLLHQGALAFESWTGVEAPLAVMRRALTGG